MAGDWQQGKFTIPTFKDWVPHNVKFSMLILFAFCFQMAGGVYLGSINQMTGGCSLMQEEVMFAAYSSFIGLTVTFPLLFRIKFRFKSRNIIMFAALILAFCNIITMNSSNPLLLCIAGFVAGSCRLIGTFECMSTLQGKLAPNYDQTIFFCVLFCIILTAIQLSGVATVYLDIYLVSTLFLDPKLTDIQKLACPGVAVHETFISLEGSDYHQFNETTIKSLGRSYYF